MLNFLSAASPRVSATWSRSSRSSGALAGGSIFPRLLPSFSGLLVLVAVILRSTICQADPPKELQVLTLSSADAFENARTLSAALKLAISEREGWTVPPGDYSLEVLSAVLNCTDPPDHACLEKLHAKTKSERFVWGVMKQAGSDVEVALHLSELGKPEKDTVLRYSAALTKPQDPALIAVANEGLGKLLGEVSVVVRSKLEGGELWVNGQRRGVIRNGQATLNAPAGQIRIMVRGTTGATGKGSFALTAGTVTTVSVEPTLNGPSNDPTGVGSHSGPNYWRIAGYGALGLGTALVAVGSGFWVNTALQKNDSTWQDYRNEVPVKQDPCAQAEKDGRTDIVDRCSSNQTARTAALVLIPAGLVVAGIGSVLLVTDPKGKGSEAHARADRNRHHKSEAGKLAILPSLGTSRAAVDFRFTF